MLLASDVSASSAKHTGLHIIKANKIHFKILVTRKVQTFDQDSVKTLIGN